MPVRRVRHRSVISPPCTLPRTSAINLSRSRTVQTPFGIAIMAAGTALVVVGLYIRTAPH